MDESGLTVETERMDYQYLKPVLPQGWFMLVDLSGESEGPFNDTELVESELSGKPWAIVQDGRPQIFRLLSQEGNKLTLERKIEDKWEEYQLTIRRIERRGDGWVNVD